MFAQEELRLLERPPLPVGNQAVLMRTQQQLTQDLQQVQRMLSVIPPTETQIVDALKTQQSELTKQIKDLAQQLQVYEAPQDVPTIPGMSMPPMREPELPFNRSQDPMMSGMPMPYQTQPMMPSTIVPQQTMPHYNPPYSMGMPGIQGMANPPTWGAPAMQAWGGMQPDSGSSVKELAEIKQSVNSMRREIAELKETIKTLEAQIQLLNRNILLSEKAREQ